MPSNPLLRVLLLWFSALDWLTYSPTNAASLTNTAGLQLLRRLAKEAHELSSNPISQGGKSQLDGQQHNNNKKHSNSLSANTVSRGLLSHSALASEWCNWYLPSDSRSGFRHAPDKCLVNSQMLRNHNDIHSHSDYRITNSTSYNCVWDFDNREYVLEKIVCINSKDCTQTWSDRSQCRREKMYRRSDEREMKFECSKRDCGVSVRVYQDAPCSAELVPIDRDNPSHLSTSDPNYDKPTSKMGSAIGKRNEQQKNGNKKGTQNNKHNNNGNGSGLASKQGVKKEDKDDEIGEFSSPITTDESLGSFIDFSLVVEHCYTPVSFSKSVSNQDTVSSSSSEGTSSTLMFATDDGVFYRYYANNNQCLGNDFVEMQLYGCNANSLSQTRIAVHGLYATHSMSKSSIQRDHLEGLFYWDRSTDDDNDDDSDDEESEEGGIKNHSRLKKNSNKKNQSSDSDGRNNSAQSSHKSVLPTAIIILMGTLLYQLY